MAEIEVENLSKEYDLHTMGLTDVSLTFADGSLTVVAGAAGCGKSTLLFAVGGLVDITAGELLIGGACANEMPPKERDVCLMREGEVACRGSVSDNIAYGLRLRSVPQSEITARVANAAATLGLTEKLRVNIKKLSELDRRRVSLARGLARRPSVFLLDEPLFNIGEDERLALAADIKKAHAASGLTFIMATSNGGDAFLCGGRIVVMKDGRVVCAGTERELTDAPPDMFTAALLGEDPMSFFAWEGSPIGVRRGGLVLDDSGEITAEVVSCAPGEALVKPDADAAAMPVAADRAYPVGATVRLRLVRGARFDADGKFAGSIDEASNIKTILFENSKNGKMFGKN